MPEFKYVETYTSDILRDIQPQIEAENMYATKELQSALSIVDPGLSDEVVESLKSKDTAEQGISVLRNSLTEEQALELLRNSKRASADFDAFRNPSFEFDTSLLNQNAINEHASFSSLEMSQRLFQQGEVASAGITKYLSDIGIKSGQEVNIFVDKYKNALRSLEDVTFETGKRKDTFVALIKHPFLGDVPLLAATGPVTDGVWRPKVKIMGGETPVKERITSLLDRKDIKTALKANNITSVEPIFYTLEDAPEGIRTRREKMPSFKDIEASEEYATLDEGQKQKVKKLFFDKYLSRSPKLQKEIRNNPLAYKEFRREFVGPEVFGDVVSRTQEAVEGLGPVGRPVVETAAVVSALGQAATGALEGFLPERIETGSKELFGDRPLARAAGRFGSDAAVYAVGGIPVGIALEAARGAGSGIKKGLPLLPQGPATEIIPFGPEPTSVTAEAARAAMRAGILIKGIEKGGPLLGAAIKKFAGATASLSTGALNAAKNAIRGIRGKDILVYEDIARASETTLSKYIAHELLEKAPEVYIKKSGPIKIIMKDGRILGRKDFPQEMSEEMDKLAKDPTYVPNFARIPKFENVARIEGTLIKTNNFFKLIDSDISVVGNVAAKGAKIRTLKGFPTVIREGLPNEVFSTQEEALNFIAKLPLAPTSVENLAFKEILKEGDNPYFLTSRLVNPGKFVGELPKMPEWGQVGGRLVTAIRIPKARFLEIERRSGAPLYSRLYVPVERAVRASNAFQNPFIERANALMKGISKKQSPGYTQLMQTTPGSQAWDKLVRDYKLDVDKGLGIRSYFLDVTKALGLDGEEFLRVTLPRLQEFGSITDAFPSGQLPKSVTFFADAVSNGLLPLAQRELNISTLMINTLNQGSFKRFVGDTWEEGVRVADAIAKRPHEYLAAERFLRTVRGFGSETDEEMMQALGTAWHKISVGSGIVPANASKTGKQLMGSLFAVTASSFFSFRPAAVARQFLQTSTVIAPRFGAVNVTKAVNRLIHPDEWENVVKSGALNEVVFSKEEGMSMIGGKIFRKVDTYQRGVSAKTQEMLFDSGIAKYGPDIPPDMWRSFARHTKLSLFDKVQQAEWQNMIRNGDVMGAKLSAIRNAAEDTNWQYSYENRPDLLTGVAGRLFGQFGVYSLYYAEYLKQILTRGDWDERVAWATRFFVYNKITYETLSGVFGADATNWLFTQPLFFTGGPAFTLMADAVKSGKAGPEGTRAYNSLTAKRVFGMFVPGSQSLSDAISALNTTNGQDFARELFLSMPKEKH